MISALAVRAALRAAGRTIAAGFAWLLEHPLQALLITAAAWILWLQLVTLPARDAVIAQRDATIVVRTEERDQEIAAHRQTKIDYRAAQIEAAELERARLARVESEQERISHEAAQNYHDRIAAARADAERLRREAVRPGAGPAGAGGSVAVPGIPDPAGGADAPAGDRGLSLEERLIATEQAIQLDELISWVERQSAIDPNR